MVGFLTGNMKTGLTRVVAVDPRLNLQEIYIMNVETLKDFRLTEQEWHALMHCGELGTCPSIVDVLVLAGLAEWDIGEFAREEGEWLLTDEGRAACDAIDMILDWDDFVFAESSESPSDGEDTVFLNGKPIKRSEALEMVAERPKPLSVGSLVRHIRTGGVGLITKHTMYNADWGGFYVDFVKPVDNVIDGRVTNQLSHMFDRADKFERV
jgi:hypothetical protein